MFSSRYRGRSKISLFKGLVVCEGFQNRFGIFSKICRRETAEQHRLVIFLFLFFLPSGVLSHLELGGDDGKHNLIVAVPPRVRIRHGYVYALHDVLSKLDILVPEIRYFSPELEACTSSARSSCSSADSATSAQRSSWAMRQIDLT